MCGGRAPKGELCNKVCMYVCMYVLLMMSCRDRILLVTTRRQTTSTPKLGTGSDPADFFSLMRRSASMQCLVSQETPGELETSLAPHNH